MVNYAMHLGVSWGSSYTGPGNVAGVTALAWGGLRAYSAAYAASTGAMLDLVDQSNINSVTINVKTNGDPDIAAINTWVTANSVTSIRVAKIYDQSGNGKHWTPNGGAGAINKPVLELTGLGTGPAIRIKFTVASANTMGATLASATSQPFAISSVAECWNTSSGNGSFVGTSVSGAMGIGFNDEASPRRVYANAGSTGLTTATVADNSPGAVAVLFNGASSSINLNGTAASVSLGTNALGTDFYCGVNPSFEAGDVYMTELGAWPGSSWTTTTNSNVVSNAKTYWGF